MSSNKYIATVMKRSSLSEDNYVFIYNYVIFGEYDKDKKIFIDEYGKEYPYMMTNDALNKDEAVYHILEIDKLSEILKKNNNSFKDLVLEYTKQIQSIVYFVGYTDDHTPYLSSINIAEIRRQANVIREKGKPEHKPVLDKLEKMMLDTVDGKYTIDELKEMIETLTDVKDTIENTVDTMITKIGAIENNMSYMDYMKEQLAKPDENVPPKSKNAPKEEPKSEPQKLLEAPKEKPDTSKLKEDLKKKYKVEEKKKEETVLIKKTKPTDIIDIEDIYNKVTKTLIAQDEPTRRLLAELARKELEPSKKREAILLAGPTGVGKTELIRLLSVYLNKVLLIVDSTQITTAGYVGKDITEILWDLYVKCGKNKEKAEHSILYFDEIDKKGSEKNDDINGRGVLNALLPFIEGATYDAALDSKSSTQIVKLDTSNMTIIVGGAFSDMYKHLIKKNEIGFNTEKNSLDTPEYRKAEIKDFVEYGMMTYEFMGRVVPIKLNDLGRNDLKRVVLESDQSALRKQESIFKKLGVKLTYTSEYIDKIVDKAYSLKTGARALNGIIDESTWKAFDYIYTHQGQYTGVLLDGASVEDSSHYELIKKKNKK